MEEKETKKVESIDTNGLVEVKSYKKCNKGLGAKVAACILAVALAVSAYFNYYCFKNHRNHECDCKCECECEECKCHKKEKEEGVTNPVPSPKPSPSDGQGGTNDTVGTGENGGDPCDPDGVEKKWETEKLPSSSTVTFKDAEKAEEKIDTLTAAQKAYVKEYMDYYGLTYEDAVTSYFEFGPLVVPADSYYQTGNNTVEYETYYEFDADDIAAINAFITELGMTRSEAQTYYVTVVMPTLGKTPSYQYRMIYK